MVKMVGWIVLAIVALALGAAPAVSAELPENAHPQGMIYADGRIWRTFVTVRFDASQFSDRSLDKLYALGYGLISVSDTAPGSEGYSGARWVVVAVQWHVEPIQLVSEQQVLRAASEGLITLMPTTNGISCPLVAPT